MLTGAKEGKKWSLCLNQGQNWNLVCFSFFPFFFLLYLMLFGSLWSHKYTLTLCFELINFTDKRPMLYERSMSHSHYFQLSPNSMCVKANPFSGFFSCKDLALCFLSQRQATWACATHPTTLTLSSSMGHAIGKSRIKRSSFFCSRSLKWNNIDDFMWSLLFSGWGMPSKVYLKLNKHFISEKSLQNTCTHQAHFFCSWCQNWHAIQSHGKQWLHLECSSSLVSFSNFSAPFQVLHEPTSRKRQVCWLRKGARWAGAMENSTCPSIWFANLFFSFWYLFV